MGELELGYKGYIDFLSNFKRHLDPSTFDELGNVEYGQWEICFEALLHQLMKLNRMAISLDISTVTQLAKEAEVLSEGILDPDTWKQFNEWLNA